MALENGEWILHGADWDSPDRIRSWQELIEYVDAVGFLPLFKNEVEGFSVEEKTSPLFGGLATRSRIPGSGGLLLPGVKK